MKERLFLTYFKYNLSFILYVLYYEAILREYIQKKKKLYQNTSMKKHLEIILYLRPKFQ